MTEKSNTDRAKVNDPFIGKKINQEYEILDLIGYGGMSTVYKVKRLSDGKILASKTLRNADENSAKRFEAEVKIHKQLKHKNIVEAIDCVIDSETERAFFLMEYIEGYSLTQLLKETGFFKEDRALINFVRQISAALSFSHKKGVLHRDIKPGNIFMLFNENDDENPFTVKIIDFGLAKVETEMQRLTKTGMVIGSPTYMSPEQCMGKRLDTRADVYSLGALLYHLITGFVPYKDKDVIKVFEKHCDPSIRPGSVSLHNKDLNAINQLDTIIQTAMQTEPAKRFNTVDEMLNSFEFWYKCVERGLFEKKLAPEDFIKEENIPDAPTDPEADYQEELVALLRAIRSPKKAPPKEDDDKIEQVDELDLSVKITKQKKKREQSVFIKSKRSGDQKAIDSKHTDEEETGEIPIHEEEESKETAAEKESTDSEENTTATETETKEKENSFDVAALDAIGSGSSTNAQQRAHEPIAPSDVSTKYGKSDYTSSVDATSSTFPILFLTVGIVALVAAGAFFINQVNMQTEDDLNNPEKFHKPPPKNQIKKPVSKHAGKLPKLAGVWSSEFGLVNIQQDGRIITGTWTAENQGTGTFRGKYDPQSSVLNINYFQPWDKSSGKAEFMYDHNTKSLRGRWTQDDGEMGYWTLTR